MKAPGRFRLDADGELRLAPGTDLGLATLEELDRLGLIGLAAYLLEEPEEPRPVPSAVRRRLVEGLARARALGLRWTAIAERVLGTLHDAGIETLLFKGGDLGLHVYPEPGLREMVDLDLLVRPEDLEAASVVLQRLGFRESCQRYSREWYLRCRCLLPPMIHPELGVQLDVHGTVLPPYSPFLLPDSLVWSGTLPSRWPGARRPAREVAVWLSIVHARVMHPSVSTARRRLHVDLMALISCEEREPIDWSRFLDLCELSGVCIHAAAALSGTEARLAPEPVLDRLERLRRDRFLSEMVLRLRHEVRHLVPFRYVEGPPPPDAGIQFVKRPIRTLLSLVGSG